jgi:hypothetical protein
MVAALYVAAELRFDWQCAAGRNPLPTAAPGLPGPACRTGDRERSCSECCRLWRFVQPDLRVDPDHLGSWVVTGVRPGRGHLDHADDGRQTLERLGALLREALEPDLHYSTLRSRPAVFSALFQVLVNQYCWFRASKRRCPASSRPGKVSLLLGAGCASYGRRVDALGWWTVVGSLAAVVGAVAALTEHRDRNSQPGARHHPVTYHSRYSIALPLPALASFSCSVRSIPPYRF